MALNPPAALVTCGMMLFLPVQSTWPSHRVLKARNLGSDGLISSYGIVGRHEGLHHVQVQGIGELHRWYLPGTEDPSLLELQRRVLRPKQRSTTREVISWTILFLVVQYGLCFGVIAASMIIGLYLPWDCTGPGPGISSYILPFWCFYLFVMSMAVYGIAAMKNKGFQEIVFLTPLVSGAVTDECTCCSVVNHLPQWNQLHKSERSLLNHSSSLIALLFKRRTYQVFLSLLRSQPPLAVMLHQTPPTGEEGDTTPLISIVQGFAKALILVFATFICASLYGNDLFSTFYFVVLVTAIITLSRLLSIAALARLQDVFQLTVVEYGNAAERRGLLRLLAAMPGVVVSKNRHRLRYTAGYNVDMHRCEEWTERGLVLLLKIVVTIFCVMIIGATTLPVVLKMGAVAPPISWHGESPVIISSLWILLFLFPIGWGMWRYLGDIWSTYLINVEMESGIRMSETEMELDEVDAEQRHV
ncbi:hypothetical protein K440DRAFT_646677 [Wilcoxina mikolae CBS 423.85]|nr:hypothetical protein K440DRAFT_646677 [Wilcoxina mikolae CBS 423.85]